MNLSYLFIVIIVILIWTLCKKGKKCIKCGKELSKSKKPKIFDQIEKFTQTEAMRTERLERTETFDVLPMSFGANYFTVGGVTVSYGKIWLERNQSYLVQLPINYQNPSKMYFFATIADNNWCNACGSWGVSAGPNGTSTNTFWIVSNESVGGYVNWVVTGFT